MRTIAWILGVSVLLLSGCQLNSSSEKSLKKNDAETLAAVLAQQSTESQARYRWRHPEQTLAFFGIKPGMTVIEVLPGSGWYSRILVPYLGEQGKLIGADYPWELWKTFGFMDEQTLAKRRNWTQDWVADVAAWNIEQGADVEGVILGDFPNTLENSVDGVLFIRALHNLARFESTGEYLTSAITDVYKVLKPGGVVGVVQHEARADVDDSQARGDKGYLKKAFVIEQFTKAGFEYVGSSPVNENSQDKPGVDEVVWRLPPTLYAAKDNPEIRERMMEIGESNRMTLKFIKP